jgi:hypothetical protein
MFGQSSSCLARIPTPELASRSHRVEVVLDVFELVWETLAD